MSLKGVVPPDRAWQTSYVLQVQESVLVPGNQVLGRTHDALARAHAQHGDKQHARLHAQRALEIVTENFGGGHPVVAHQSERLQSLAVRQ